MSKLDPDLLEFERTTRCRVLLRGTGTQARPLLCSGEYSQARVRVAFRIEFMGRGELF